MSTESVSKDPAARCDRSLSISIDHYEIPTRQERSELRKPTKNMLLLEKFKQQLAAANLVNLARPGTISPDGRTFSFQIRPGAREKDIDDTYFKVTGRRLEITVSLPASGKRVSQRPRRRITREDVFGFFRDIVRELSR